MIEQCLQVITEYLITLICFGFRAERPKPGLLATQSTAFPAHSLESPAITVSNCSVPNEIANPLLPVQRQELCDCGI